jgi:hypothetical protein
MGCGLLHHCYKVRSRVASQAVFQQKRQLRVTVVHVPLVAGFPLFGERVDHFPKHMKTLVDVASLLQPLTGSLGEFLPFTPSQVHKMESLNLILT